MYHLENGNHLRVTRKFLGQERNRVELRKARLILLQHVLPTTEELVRALREAGADVYRIIGKPFSVDSSVLGRLRGDGFAVADLASYDEIEGTDYLSTLLGEASAESDKDGRRIAILEVGGYFAAYLATLAAGSNALRHLAGVVEDTTFGHNRYLEHVEKIQVPVLSVARSELKRIESRFVGKDAVMSVEHLLRERGLSISGRSALVIGYGMIGESVARALREFSVSVAVYDKHDHRNLAAYIEGFRVHTKRELLKASDIVFSATGDRAVSVDDMDWCKHKAVLASVGSKDTEFDLNGLKERARMEHVSSLVTKYTLPSEKSVFVLKNGAAVNFLLPSLPVEILDLVFSEIVVCTMLLLKSGHAFACGRVHQTQAKYLNEISKDWIKFINH